MKTTRTGEKQDIRNRIREALGEAGLGAEGADHDPQAVLERALHEDVGALGVDLVGRAPGQLTAHAAQHAVRRTLNPGRARPGVTGASAAGVAARYVRVGARGRRAQTRRRVRP